MKTFTKTLAAAVVAVLAAWTAQPAHAEECGTTLYAGFQTSYPYGVTDVQGSGKPVATGGTTRSCGKWWFDASGLKDLSGSSRFGNEVDLTGAYDSSFASPLGAINYEALVSWWMLPSFGKAKDDLVQFQLDMSRSFAFHDATITPYVRMSHLQGLGSYRNTDAGKAGVRLSIPLSSHWSLSGDGSIADEFNNGRVAKRLNATATYSAGDGWSFNAGAKLADRLKPALVLGIARQL